MNYFKSMRIAPILSHFDKLVNSFFQFPWTFLIRQVFLVTTSPSRNPAYIGGYMGDPHATAPAVQFRNEAKECQSEVQKRSAKTIV